MSPPRETTALDHRMARFAVEEKLNRRRGVAMCREVGLDWLPVHGKEQSPEEPRVPHRIEQPPPRLGVFAHLRRANEDVMASISIEVQARHRGLRGPRRRRAEERIERLVADDVEPTPAAERAVRRQRAAEERERVARTPLDRSITPRGPPFPGDDVEERAAPGETCVERLARPEDDVAREHRGRGGRIWNLEGMTPIEIDDPRRRVRILANVELLREDVRLLPRKEGVRETGSLVCVVCHREKTCTP